MEDRSKRRKGIEKTNCCCPHLPQEILHDILLRVPTNYLLDLRFVCKSWLKLITSPDFTKSHALLLKDEDTRLLVRWPVPFFKVQSIPLYSLLNNVITSTCDLCFPITNTHGGGMFVGSCKGIICLYFEDGSLVLWNPCTGMYETIYSVKQLGSGSYGVYGFAYLDSSDRFVVVCQSTTLSKSCNEGIGYVTQTEVWSSKAQGWRRISDFPLGTPFFNAGKFVNGSLYWIASREPGFNLGLCFNNSIPWFLVSFEVEQEMYTEVVPPKFAENDYDLTLGVLKQCLSLLCNYGNSHADLWVLASSGVSWTKLFTIPYTHGPSSFQYSSLLIF